jgi:hypothetical protein
MNPSTIIGIAAAFWFAAAFGGVAAAIVMSLACHAVA